MIGFAVFGALFGLLILGAVIYAAVRLGVSHATRQPGSAPIEPEGRRMAGEFAETNRAVWEAQNGGRNDA